MSIVLVITFIYDVLTSAVPYCSKMEINGLKLKLSVRCQVSDVRCQMSGDNCQVSIVRCQVSDAKS